MSRRVAVLLAAVGMLVLMGALGGVAWAAPGPPTVVRTVPEDFAEGVDYNANVRIKFSEAMMANSINSATVYLLDFNCHQCSEDRPLIPSTVKYNASNSTAVLNPTEPLPDGQWAVIVEGLADEDNLAVTDRRSTAMAEEYFFTFQTGTGWDGTNPPPCTVGCEPVEDPGAQWLMDEEISGQMLDSSGNNNTGTPVDVLQTGSSYVFNGSTSYVTVPDSDSLDPQENDITLSASVMVTDTPMDDDSYDIVRKGLAGRPGGDYKMEIKRAADPTVGELHCLFKGDGGTVDKVAQRDIVDGEWHTLECIKTSTSVVASVDGSGSTKAGSAGSISNGSEVMVGAKTADPLDDVFYGSMDFVSIIIAQ